MVKFILNGLFTLLLGIFLFIAGYWFGQSPYAPVTFFFPAGYTPDNVAETFSPFWEVWQLVHTRYYDLPVDDVALTEGAIAGMLATLEDPYTRYLPPADEQAARESMAGEIEGIGVQVEFRDGDIVIVAPFEGSPAEASGLQAGDILREADGVDLTGMDLTEAAQLVRGPAGTTVVLVVERGGEHFTVEVVRDVVRIPSVRGEMLEGNLAYVRLSNFGNRSTEEMAATIEELLGNNPAGLILDLRGNPGGALDTAVEIADLFLGEGIILTERYGSGDEHVFHADEEQLVGDLPMVILVDEGSASAAEVLAGAIRDHGRAILVGQTTFGKGTVQTWQPLSNEGGVRITIARWLTPQGTWVNGAGLAPDIEVALPDGDGEGEWVDTQLQAAMEHLTGRAAAHP